VAGAPLSARGRPPARGRFGSGAPMLERSVSAWAAKSDPAGDDHHLREATFASSSGAGDIAIGIGNGGRGGSGGGGGVGSGGRGGGDGGDGGGRGLAALRTTQSQRRPRGDRSRSPPEAVVVVVNARDSSNGGGGG
ncbi:unnamed protein product, partial [Laminaria digitata]